MEDYKEEMKKLFLKYYAPTGENEIEYLTTESILYMFQGIIPSEPINEHDIYEIMNEMGFDKELIEDEVAREFKWVVYKNTP